MNNTKLTSFEIAQIFYAHLDKRVSWEAFKQIYNQWIGADQ
jgi:hypothetical protein